MRAESESTIRDIVQRIVIAPVSTTHLEEATKIAERALGVEGIDLTSASLNPRKFSVGEYCPAFQLERGQDLRGRSVYVIVTPGPYKSPEELVQRAALTAFAAKENNADRVVMIETDFSHGRQDRGPDEDPRALGEPTTVRWRARQYRAAGVDRVLTLHGHSPRIAGYFAIEYGLVPPELLPGEAQGVGSAGIRVPVHVDVSDPDVQQAGKNVFRSISPHAFLADYIRNASSLGLYLGDGGARLALKATDKGNRAFIDALHEALFLPNAVRLYCSKARSAKNSPQAVDVEIEDVRGDLRTMDRMVELFADDGLDTGGTMLKGVRWSEEGNVSAKTGKRYGRPEDRFVYFTHAWLGGQGFETVQRTLHAELRTGEIVTSNSRPYVGDGQYYRLKDRTTVLRLAGLWADAIRANELGVDVESRYVGFSSSEEQHDFLAPLYALKRHSRHFLASDRGQQRDRPFLHREQP